MSYCPQCRCTLGDGSCPNCREDQTQMTVAQLNARLLKDDQGRLYRYACGMKLSFPAGVTEPSWLDWWNAQEARGLGDRLGLRQVYEG
jgi:hypothetical protein